MDGNHKNVFTGLSDGTYTVYVQDSHGCQAVPQTVTITPPPLLEITSVTVNQDVLCYGGSTGSLLVEWTGGTPNYQVAVNGIYQSVTSGTTYVYTGLPAGTYSDIKVRDANGCIASYYGEVTITQPPLLIATATSTPATCPGGSDGTITVTASGGAPDEYGQYHFILTSPSSVDYGWQISPYTITGLTPGAKQGQVIDANGCTVNWSQAVGPANIEITAYVTDPTCYGEYNGEINVSVSGGTPPYVYEYATSSTGPWMAFTPPLNDLSAGTYYIRITDEHYCLQESSAITLSNPNIQIVISNIKNPLCYELQGSFDVTVTGGQKEYLVTVNPGGQPFYHH